MILKEFQEEAIRDLLDYTDSEKLIILDSPTGSGKTIILINYIDRLLDIKDNTAVIWFTPGAGELEEQSQEKMNRFIPNRKTKTIDQVLTQGIEAKDTIFVNWEKVTKSDNNALKDSERDNLKDKVRKAKLQGTEFIIIIDEEHKNDTKKAKSVIDLFDAKLQIRASATPDNLTGVKVVKITEKEVIAEGLITKSIYVNEGAVETDTESNETKLLLKLAVEKQKEIQKEYSRIGKNINPMVLIQVPNNDDNVIIEVEE